ncbi:Electron transport complex protein RnfC [Marinomonas aquimarina]|uniref:Ion-translocating oxidoreductase complex subunit C n=1 Tax=Marinomonas aquimarina TaxID=295068 RepID=A0A1A8T887_9GAMM|nr:electron transport complex subunit RsxC [Marinomonas aquimarina]SBS28563.1 Electron transport complex protein RnfC [Marinomonas aquimarina]
MQTPPVYSFHGGIHPPENKAQSLQLPLGKPSLPRELILPLGQHIGQASRPLVEVGAKVKKGEAIAMNNGFLSSFLHAPTSGTISAIESRPIAHPSGLSDMSIILTPDGADEWTELEPLANWKEIGKTDVLAFLSEKGIIGMGGAGFPTQVKLQGAHKHPLTHFIINAAECEPYITADDMLIREKTLELVLGIEILQHIVEAENVVIGIEDNKPTAINALQQLLRERQSSIQVAVVPTKYPSGGEKQLIKLLTDKEVPSGQYPADIGILCQNVGTCVAVYEAIQQGRPLISRYTTLTGDALKAPQNVEVLLGTPIDHLLEYADLQDKKLSRLVMGGPMMGFTLDSGNVPVVKTTNCVLAATKKELPAPYPEQACIRCGMCEQACPASLLPQQLLWFSKSQELEKAEHYNLFDCIECGACSYVCPSSIPLVQYYRHTKAEIRDTREAAVKSDIAKQRFEARKARHEAEAAEKEAKRLARQGAAKPAAKKPAKPAPEKADAAPAAPVADEAAKKAKVDLAIAKAKLKKLEKALLEAQEKEHTEEISALQTQVDEAKKDIAELDKLVASAPAAAPAKKAAAPALNDEAKKAKVDVALASTKLKKAEKQLAEDPDNQELKDKVAGFTADLKAAQETFDKLGGDVKAAPATAAKPALSDEAKKAKVDVALASTKLKKAQKQLAEDPDNAELKAKVEGFENDLKEAEARFAKLDSAPSAQAAPAAKPALSDEAKKAKVDVALASTKLKKVQKQLADEPDNDELKAKAADFEKSLKEAEARLAELDSAPAAATPAAKPAMSDEYKKAKVDVALASTKLKKLQKQLADDAQNSELQGKVVEFKKALKDAEARLAALEAPTAAPAVTEAPVQAAPAADEETLRKLKIDAAIAKAAVKKAEKALTKAIELGSDDKDSLEQQVTKAKAHAEEIEKALQNGGQVSAQAPADSANAAEDAAFKERLKKQKVAAALAKAQVNKLKRQLDADPTAESLQQELSAAEQKQQEEEAKLEQLTNTQENR